MRYSLINVIYIDLRISFIRVGCPGLEVRYSLINVIYIDLRSSFIRVSKSLRRGICTSL